MNDLLNKCGTRPNKQWANKVYKILLQLHGNQEWWPANSKFEVMVGAILTQNTAWTNVEKAIANLKTADSLCADVIASANHTSIANLIKPSGYFNVKAQRLKKFCEWYVERGGFPCLRYWSTPKLRRELLSVYGVGYETADDILLYAFNRPVFVIDAYTRRIFSRLGVIAGDESYNELRLEFELQLQAKPKMFGEYHALVVQHGKYVCKPKPNCNVCGLSSICKYNRECV